jgi:hypothetical protein
VVRLEALHTSPQTCTKLHHLTTSAIQHLNYTTQQNEMGSIGIPIKLLNEAQGHVCTLELTSGQIFRGKLIEGTYQPPRALPERRWRRRIMFR